MSVENPKYFKHFESEHTPKITWQEMIEENVVIGPVVLRNVLKEANDFLTSEPGPNLAKRKKIVPPWFDYWRSKLLLARVDKPDNFVRSNRKMVSFDEVPAIHENWPEVIGRETGILFVAGAEGHAGHVHAAEHMRTNAGFVTWAFEQEDYMLEKPRNGSFLPLEVRLSMWFYEHNIDLLTVLPGRESGRSISEHYKLLFEKSGVGVMFADEYDPFLHQKIGRINIRPIPKYATIPHLDVPSTSDGVERLMDLDVSTPDDRFIKYHEGLRLSDSIFTP